MKIYNYDQSSCVLIGESVADENPVLPGDYLIPAFATTDEPPAPQANKTPVYKNGAWSRISDFRGTDAWRTDTGEKVTITKLGTLNSQGLTDQAYPDYPATWDGTVWVGDLSGVATAKLAQLKSARNSAEAATPFVYDGSSFDYDSLSRERINAAISGATIAAISGVAIDTVVAEWTLADNTKRSMTIADWLAFRQAEITRSGSCHTHYNALKSDIEAIVEETAAMPPTKTEAEAIVAINAIAWA